MPDSPQPAASLIMIQFLSWVADRPRSYAQTMDAWRTSCPRLSVWEDAIIEDLVRIGGGDKGNGTANGACSVTLTERGRQVLLNAKAGTKRPGVGTKSRHRRRAAAESRTY
jgi:hypothetical protein